ncbi:DDE-type integrase/transposase/recombinase [Anaerobranca gottschalkii]|uniref:Transposase InsO and inactivated derivatives n=1 Tax=Anaerobranca gottschalkii DSM 13577 TaxID=1120990 RepID=A0A1H9YR16_9FIRM|nr:DDE-type integrase/transposase/recombinase [Anaerobranca gottschalkii]SES71556.1 Transposase InsO and inactivated derivatives [Anaerobranca gottschalkii DSM 13577]
MTENDREQIALFRYGLIAPILNGQVEKQKDYLAKISAITHQVPYYGIKEFTPKTIEMWLRAYRREGFNGLKPKPRNDKGSSRSISPELKEKILSARKENLGLSVKLFYDQLVLKGTITPNIISYSTMYRFLKAEGLLGKEALKEPQRKRFSYDKVNVLWQGDMAVGPYLRVDGKKIKTFLFAFIDDCSRIIPFAAFVTSEKFSSVRKVFSEALLRRGIPKILYLDNGKVYRSDQLHLACASLGITLTHTKPYDAASKGKIERFFLTMRKRFLPLLKEEDLTSIDNLNRKFWQWLEEDYHRKIHSSLNMTPLDKFMSQMSEVKMVDDPTSLKHLFLKREYRKVKHDGTISVNCNLYEVPAQLIGEKIQIRFDPETFEEILIYKEDLFLGLAKKVNFADNAKVKRGIDSQQSLLSFRKIHSIERSANNV